MKPLYIFSDVGPTVFSLKTFPRSTIRKRKSCFSALTEQYVRTLTQIQTNYSRAPGCETESFFSLCSCWWRKWQNCTLKLTTWLKLGNVYLPDAHWNCFLNSWVGPAAQSFLLSTHLFKAPHAVSTTDVKMANKQSLQEHSAAFLMTFSDIYWKIARCLQWSSALLYVVMDCLWYCTAAFVLKLCNKW